MNPENILKLVKTMRQLGFTPKVPVKAEELADPQKRADWIKNKNMQVFSFYHPDNPYALVDIMIDNPLNYEELSKDKEQVVSRGTKIFLIPKKMLIKLKQLAGREQDISDIRALLESEGNK